MLSQIKNAISIFEAAHPGKQALFIFDQFSAHASLPPDALKAFEMNKGDGGAQQRQKDTIIPLSNPSPSERSHSQSMLTQDGQQKGLKQILEEQGFDVKKL